MDNGTAIMTQAPIHAGDRVVIVHGPDAIAPCAVACWHEEKLIALEERIAQAVKGRINSRATGQTKSE